MLKEFKKFALRGNVIDLAVGVIIGGAFGKIVSSMVNDVLMPIIGLMIGGINFKDLKLVLEPATDTMAEVAIRYGAFMQSVIDFIIIAVSIFLFVKIFENLKKKEITEVKPVSKPNQEIILEEIRDLLKSK